MNRSVVVILVLLLIILVGLIFNASLDKQKAKEEITDQEITKQDITKTISWDEYLDQNMLGKNGEFTPMPISVFEKLGSDIEIKGENIIISKGENKIFLKIGSNKGFFNDKEIWLYYYPKKKHNRVILYTGFVIEGLMFLGYKVENNEILAIIISDEITKNLRLQYEIETLKHYDLTKILKNWDKDSYSKDDSYKALHKSMESKGLEYYLNLNNDN